MNLIDPYQQVIPREYRVALQRHGIAPTRYVLTVSILKQCMILWEKFPRLVHGHNLNPAWSTRWRRFLQAGSDLRGEFVLRRRLLVSTSKFGIGQEENSHGTPLGLHSVARKVGGGRVPGTVFEGRRPVGNKWQGMAQGRIMHRILWLAGLEPGFNRGGSVDTFRRYIYIHGVGEESTLGRPDSLGCIHAAMDDLLPLFDLVPTGTHVWIGRHSLN